MAWSAELTLKTVFLFALLAVNQILAEGEVELMRLKYAVDQDDYSISLEVNGSSVAFCKSPGRCNNNGCVFDVQYSSGHVEFLLKDIADRDCKLVLKDGTLATITSSDKKPPVSVVYLRNTHMTVDLDKGKALLVFCPRVGCSLERQKTNSHRSTIIFCSHNNTPCKVNKEVGVEAPIISSKCFSQDGRWFYFPNLQQEHAGKWIFRSNGAVHCLKINVNESPSMQTFTVALPDSFVWKPEVKSSGTRASASSEQQVFIWTLCLSVAIFNIWAQFHTWV